MIFENGKICQDFIYNGNSIKLIGFYENGGKKYEGEITVGIEKFNKGPIICSWNPVTEISCKVWQEDGRLSETKKIKFHTGSLSNIEDRKYLFSKLNDK